MTSPTVLKIGSGITLGYSPVLAGVNSVPLHVYSVDELPTIEEYVMGIYHNDCKYLLTISGWWAPNVLQVIS